MFHCDWVAQRTHVVQLYLDGIVMGCTLRKNLRWPPEAEQPVTDCLPYSAGLADPHHNN